MSEIVLPLGEKLVHKSELFKARVESKYVQSGLTRDMHRVLLTLLESDPNVTRTALVAIAEQDYQDIEVGETVQIRLYEHEDGKWLTNPPIIPD
jgi:hypothetical protein